MNIVVSNIIVSIISMFSTNVNSNPTPLSSVTNTEASLIIAAGS